MLLMKNILGSEYFWRESILACLIWLGVTSMRYIGSPYIEKIITSVTSAGNRVLFDSI